MDGDGLDEVIVGFPGQGLWQITNDTRWEWLHNVSPAAMVAGRFH